MAETGKKRTIPIFIGYRLKARDPETVKSLMPKFEASKVLKDPEKIKADIARKEEEFLACAASLPYTSTFDEIFMSDRTRGKPLQWLALPDKKLPSLRFRESLLKAHPDAWGDDPHDRPDRPSVVIYGFDPGTFLKIAGLECSMPPINKPFPIQFWYDNRDHRDMANAVLPTDYAKYMNLADVIRFRMPTDPESAAAWTKHLEGWSGPGVSPEKDAKIATELAVQLRMVPS